MYAKIILILTCGVTSILSGGIRNFFSGIEKITLNAPRSEKVWTVFGVNDSTKAEIRVPASVPGGIYTDLEENGILTSPLFYEYHDLENKWVGRMNWTYTRSFEVTKSLLEKTELVLVCEGLDTVSQVSINGHKVGESENMFVRYTFNIKKDWLKLGDNTITISFESPVKYAQSNYRKHIKEHGYAVKPERLVSSFRGEDQVQFIRKTQSSFSWDWGNVPHIQVLEYGTAAKWKDIYIEGYNGAVIRDVLIFPTSSQVPPDETADTHWNITARVYYDCATEGKPAILKFRRSGSQQEVVRNVKLKKGKGNEVDISISESGAHIKLWWPNGYGEQHLYTYNLILGMDDLTESSSRTIRIGFRTVELIEDFVDLHDKHKGREFYFRVNGIKMYSKGSNSIPQHVLPERITDKHTEWILRAAKMSHQNMIRVWGGGMYESDEFYDWADEYGIFIWEDFMFACALYPATKEFLGNVYKEVETQVKRLQYRTSLAMWAGNNENEGGLRGGWFGYDSHFEPDYIKLYIHTIKTLVHKLDPSRRYLPSSPTNGIKTEEEGWIASYPADLKYGDFHAYNYYADNWDWKIYTRGRYSSEYGYQSYPHYETLAETANNISRWTWNSAMLTHRQRHPNGQSELQRMIKTYFPFPRDYDSGEALPYMVYMSQLSQSMAQKTQTESYRRIMDKLDESGTGHNMGALYWQLNDDWPGCSWSSIEVNGRWKLQMYYAKKFFAPVLASPYQARGGDIMIDLISDSRHAFNGTLKVQIFKMNSNTSLVPVYEKETRAHAEFLTSKEVFLIPNSILKSLNCTEGAQSGSLNPCIVYTTLPGTPDNFLFLQYPKNKHAIQNPRLEITTPSEMGDLKSIGFSLKTVAVAPFVFLTVRGENHGYFSDNGFVQVSQIKQMTYYSENGISVEKFLKQVEIMSLYNVTTVAGDQTETHQSRKSYYGMADDGDDLSSDVTFESNSEDY